MRFGPVISLLLRPSALSFAWLQKAVSIVTPPDEPWGRPNPVGTETPALASSVPYLTHKAGGTVGAPKHRRPNTY
ncbi:hypothetical protein D3C76_25620 [compost metagenome]